MRALEAVAPAYFTHPPFASSVGEDVADFAAASGFTPDPEQRMLLAAMFAGPAGVSYQTRDRKWFSSQVAVVCSRQNLKTACMEMGVLGALWLLDAKLVLWTSHIFNPAAAETFYHFKQLIEENAHLSRRVKRIHDASGRESIELTNGARLKFLARSKATGRALSGDLVILDEAYALSTAELGALLPTRSARPNSQIWYGSSAGRLESEQLRLVRDRGREGSDRMTYAEWCSTARCDAKGCRHEVGTPGCVLDDVDEWHRANPALGRRIDVETVRDERLVLSAQEFARERLGWWDDPIGIGRVIPDAMFARLVRDSAISGAVTVVPEVSMDRSCACVWVCGAGPDGVPQVEPAERGAGTEWVADRVAEILGRNEVLAVGVRSGGPAASLIGDVERVCAERGVEFVKVHSGPMAGFCGQFFDAVMGDVPGLHHRGDAGLFDQVKAAKRKRSVDAWSWERSDVDVDMADLVAATAAFGLWLERDPDDYDVMASIL